MYSLINTIQYLQHFPTNFRSTTQSLIDKHLSSLKMSIKTKTILYKEIVKSSLSGLKKKLIEGDASYRRINRSKSLGNLLQTSASISSKSIALVYFILDFLQQ